mgnify:CR=1 FL=1
MLEPMSVQEAIEAISTGHVIYSVEWAERVASAFGVTLPKSLIKVYESERHPMGLTMYNGPEKGVWSLDMARHVAICLGVEDKTRGFIGRGSQAQEYARAAKRP